MATQKTLSAEDAPSTFAAGAVEPALQKKRPAEAGR